MKLIAPVLLALCAPAMGKAQASAPAAAAVDPARLTAARALIDVLMPPGTREQLVTGIIAPMQANMRRGMEENPRFATELRGNPRARAIFDKFMAKQDARVAETLRVALPGMVDAMASAYARRFTLVQLAELRAFFETPTGRAYMQASYTIMSDPDVQTWQRQMMTQALAGVERDVTEMAAEIAALGTP